MPERVIGYEDSATKIIAPPISKYYLLAIGIDRYTQGINDLPNPVRDVANVVNELTNKYTFHCPDGSPDLRDIDVNYRDRRIYATPIPVHDSLQTICLYNEQATKQNIIDKIESIYAQLNENDALLVYFAGHGIKAVNNAYYLIASDSILKKQGTYLAITEISGYFIRFTENRKCRDFFMILDACYAGSALVGYQGEQHAGIFSRKILTSCLPDQSADDGLKDRGSAFVNAFVDVLQQNQDNSISYDEMKSTVKGKYSKRADKPEAQIIVDGVPPGSQTGLGSFIFEKREKEKPDIHHLKESLIDHLNFTLQRHNLTVNYSKAKNHLNIITTQAASLNVQRILSKIIFRWLITGKRIEVCEGAFYMAQPIMIKPNQYSDIWTVLYNGIKDDRSILIKSNENVFAWYFEKLRANEQKLYGKRHVILWMGFEIGGDEIFAQIKAFCNEFSQMFLKEFASLDEDKKRTFGKMFIIFSDQRISEGGAHEEHLKDISGKDKYNFIPTQRVDNINSNNIIDWLTEFAKGNLSSKIQELTKFQIESSDETVYCYEDFITKICSHCQFSDQEILELHTSLYDFNNKTII